MSRYLVVFAVLASCVVEASARNPAYYGTRRATSARFYSGEYQAQYPNVVPTFTLPSYGAAVRPGFGGGYYYGRGYYGAYPVYQQPVVIYPPAVYYGF